MIYRIEDERHAVEILHIDHRALVYRPLSSDPVAGAEATGARGTLIGLGSPVAKRRSSHPAIGPSVKPRHKLPGPDTRQERFK